VRDYNRFWTKDKSIGSHDNSDGTAQFVIIGHLFANAENCQVLSLSLRPVRGNISFLFIEILHD
jgi:hypothetical protein